MIRNDIVTFERMPREVRYVSRNLKIPFKLCALAKPFTGPKAVFWKSLDMCFKVLPRSFSLFTSGSEEKPLCGNVPMALAGTVSLEKSSHR